MQDRRGRVGVAFPVRPLDIVRVPGQIPFAAELDAHGVGVAPARHCDHHLVADTDESRNRIAAKAADFPNQLAVGEIIGSDAGGTSNKLFPALEFHDNRLRPTAVLVALGPPDFFAAGLVENHDKRLILVVILNHQVLIMKDRSNALAEAQPHPQRAQVLFPFEIPLEIIGVETP